MTTTTEVEQNDKVDLTASNGSAPKRRGRPPGSKNKPKTESKTTTTTRRTRRPAATMTTTPTTAAKAKDITAHAVLIESGSVNVLLSDGTSFKIDGPVFDRR